MERKPRIACFMLVLIFSILMRCPASQAEDNGWQWVRVEPPGASGTWEVLRGTAEVTFNGTKFTATLSYHTDKIWRDFAISGTVDGENVVATEVHLDADASPLTYRGTFQKVRTPVSAPSHGWGSDRMVLNSGPYFIGLFRRVRPMDTAKSH